MLDLIFPTSTNGYKAKLIKLPALIIFTVLILTFNLVVKSDLTAQEYSQTINSENLLIQHNKIRKDNGLSELKLNPLLTKSAELKAAKMLETNCWSHYCPPGSDPWVYFDEAGYMYLYAGENLAEGFTNIDVLMNAWMNSKTHRENILKPEFKEVGFGIVTGDYQNRSANTLVVVHFGSQSQLISNDLQNSSGSINIISPTPNEVINNNYINVNGTASGFEYVDIYNNTEHKGSSNVLEGIFTFRIDDPIQGKNIISVKGSNNGKSSESTVEVSINIPVAIEGDIVLNGQSVLQLNVSSNLQKALNIAFLALLTIIFLIDTIIMSKTKAVDHKKSFSHYHFSLFLIIWIIIIVGGFAGSIGSGIFK